MGGIVSTGAEFEKYLQALFVALGYRDVNTTPASGDFGADLVMKEPTTGKTIAVQAKFYASNSPLGNTPVQEIVAALAHYRADEGWVVTNNRFSKQARQLAADNNVRLVDGAGLKIMEKAAHSNAPSTPQEGWERGAADTSGIDVIVGDGKRQHAHGTPSVTRSQAEPHARGITCQPRSLKPQQATATSLNSTNSNRYYSMSDVKRRWNCSEKFVRDQMARGMHMCKRTNGRWEISIDDLLAWEKLLGKENELRKTRRNVKTAINVILIIVLVAVIIFGYSTIAELYGLPPLEKLPDYLMSQPTE